jgi:hypothetical protein
MKDLHLSDTETRDDKEIDQCGKHQENNEIVQMPHPVLGAADILSTIHAPSRTFCNLCPALRA